MSGLKELKPLKLFPDDPDPVKQITRCPKCNAEIGQQNGVYNCPKDGMVTPIFGGDYERKVPQKGERPKGFGPKDTILNPAVPFNRAAQASKDHLKRNKKDPDFAEHDEDTVKDVFVSDDINMCVDPKGKNRKFDDVSKEDVMRSCEDLAIDG